MTTPDCVLVDPYALLRAYPEVGLCLRSVPASQLYLVDPSSYYKFIPMYSTMIIALVTRGTCHPSLLAP